MNRVLVVAALFTLSAGAIAQEAAPADTLTVRAHPLAITGVAVVDVDAGALVPGQTVVIEGDRIVAVGPSASVAVPAGAEVINGAGRYLIPGLWDMHTHVSNERVTRDILFPLFVAHGVTGIRIMAADCPYEDGCGEPITTINEIQQARADIAAGMLVGPQIVAGSHYVDGPAPGEPSTRFAPGTPEHGLALARWLAERGVDFVKVYDQLPRDAYFALAAEAARLGLPVAGHVPVAVRASEASDAGQRSIEHCCAGSVLEECSAREDELRAEVLAELQGDGADLLSLMLEMVESFDAQKCDALFARFVQNETWFVPTLMVARLPDEIGSGWGADPRLRYLPREERAYWATAQPANDQLMGDAAAHERYARWARQMVGAMHAAGVGLLAGSDAGDPGVFWGIGLHEELELLVSAGLTDAEALRAATLGPAEFLGATDVLGTVETGKLADLVLLAGNPLEGIANTQRIEAVVARGRLHDRAALDALLEGVARAAQEEP